MEYFLFNKSCEGSEEDIQAFEKHIFNEFYKPYFLSGIKKYIERGDSFFIEKIEVFILNCIPESGFILNETSVGFTFGFSKEQCLERLMDMDDLFAKELFFEGNFVSNLKYRDSYNK